MVHTHRRMIPCAAALLVALGAGCTTPSSEKTGPDPAAKAGQSPQGAAPAERGASAPQPGGGGDAVPPSELEYVEMKVEVDQTTGDPKEDNFRYFKVWGELKNKSSRWVEAIVGDIRYFDASGKELSISSISTAVKEDLGDRSPGERFSSGVMYVAPGASVPVHHIRALAKLGGKYGSYKVTLRPARVAAKHPDIAIEGVQDQVANVANESLPNSTPKDHRVISATLKNNGTMGCRDAGLVVGFYDASGKLAYLNHGDASKDLKAVLAPGGSTSVKVFTLVGFDDAWRAKATIKTWASCSEPYN